MNSIKELLLNEVKEKHIVNDILQMKYEMEHREKMGPIINNINEMTCFIFNTVGDYNIDNEDLPVITKLIHHYKYNGDINTDTEIVIFKFEEYEEFILENINNIIEEKNEYFLNNEEYLNIYNIDMDDYDIYDALYED
jgi:hypothetical protein